MKALVIVDVQKDLNVEDDVISNINKLAKQDFDFIILAKNKDKEVPDELDLGKDCIIITKGQDENSYSAFADKDGNETGLRDLLSKANEIHVVGFNTEDKVSATVLDALTAFTDNIPKVYIVEDSVACLSIEDCEEVMYDLVKHGARLIKAA